MDNLDQCSNIPYPIPPRKQFKINRPNAKTMYKRAISIRELCGILFEADNNWKQIQKTQSTTNIGTQTHTAP